MITCGDKSSRDRRPVPAHGWQPAELPKAGSGWYLKIGAYVQSNPDKGDKVGAPGAVALYALKLTHTWQRLRLSRVQ